MGSGGGLVRLTGGEHSGRLLRVAASGMRPTQDKVRAALYSSLAAHVAGARVLDLFGGTGAMGLEAWSRGAARVEWVESAPASLRALRANMAALNVPRGAGRIIAADVFQRLARPCPGEGFDLVLADPPYAQARGEGWLETVAGLLADNGWIKEGGILVYETEGNDALPDLPRWRQTRDKRYGSTRLLILVRESTVTPE